MQDETEIQGTLEMMETIVYGLWHSEDKRWFILDNGEVFHTTSLPVAEVQMCHMTYYFNELVRSYWCVRPFPCYPVAHRVK